MPKPVCLESGLEDGRITFEMDHRALFNLVMEKNIVVLKNVFPGNELKSLREEVWRWGERIPMRPPQSYIDENFHAIEQGISPRQKTQHIYHAYNFKQIHALEGRLKEALLAVFEPIRNLTNRLKGVDQGYIPAADGKKLHPQLIHYPRGGGLFGPHIHPLEPQMLGPILSLSKRGDDFSSGAVGFEVDSEIVDTVDTHDIGDLVLFRFDLRHWVSFVDPERPLDFTRSDGRWTATLSYY